MSRKEKISKKIYKIGRGIVVPDGTRVFPIVDPNQQQLANIPISEELSLAYGELDFGVRSNIHVHPICTQVTYVLSGELQVNLKDEESEDMYTLNLKANEAVLTKPGSFYQLINRGETVCRLLYLCAPAFVFKHDENGNLLYNDAVVLPHTWDDLRNMNWMISELNEVESFSERRTETLELMNNAQ